ncbi:MAG: 3-oxoadipyl-CoA thiolase [Pirellulales bacterium]
MPEVYLCDTIRTPIGRYGGGLSSIRTDNLAAIPLKALMDRGSGVDWELLDDVLLGCANQAGEDNRNVARMGLLLAGYPANVPGCTINRLCGSGMDAIGTAARAIKAGEANFIIAGGLESMSRAPLVISKSATPFSRSVEMFDTTMGWRFVNKAMEDQYGVESMPETAENLAREYSISRKDQDQFALASQKKAAAAQAAGHFAEEIVSVTIPQRKGKPIIFERDEHPRQTSIEKLASLKVLLGQGGTVTAGNASGINDGAAALVVASEAAVKRHSLQVRARILGMSHVGVEPRVMGIGPVRATQKLLDRLKLTLDDMDIIELNEAFSAQSLACIRKLGLADLDPRINPQGGAIALGHPLGMSGARLVLTAVHQLQRTPTARYALCTMCIGVGQGIAMVLVRE